MKHRVVKVNSDGSIEFAKWWKDTIKWVELTETKKNKAYEVFFEVNKDLSGINGLSIKDDEQDFGMKIVVVHNSGDYIKFVTDANEFVLPSSIVPEGSVFAIGFFMCSFIDNNGIEFKKINMKNVNSSNMISTQYLFYGCKYVYEIDCDGMNTKNVTNMNGMFSCCLKLKKIKNMIFYTSKVITMNKMFYRCNKLEKLDLTHFDVSNVLNMQFMFAGCESLKKIGCYNWKLNYKVVKDVIDHKGETFRLSMFESCYARDAYFAGDELSYNDFFMYGESPKKDFRKKFKKECINYLKCVHSGYIDCTFFYGKDDIETFRGIKINDSVDKIFDKYGRQQVLDIKDDTSGLWFTNAHFKRTIKKTKKVIKLSLDFMHWDQIENFILKFYISDDNKVKIISYFALSIL